MVVSAGISNALTISSMKMLLSLIQLSKKEKNLVKTALTMALQEEILDDDTLEVIKDSFDNVKTKVGMPTNIESQKLLDYISPTLVIASEKDCLFPARRVLKRAECIIPGCQTYEFKGSGHIHILPWDVKNMIVNFLLD